MKHPRRAARDPLKGATPVGRETRTHGILTLSCLAPVCARYRLNLSLNLTLNGSN
jgi:hypothetical protein